MARYTDYTLGTRTSQQGNGNSRNFNDGDYGGGSMSGDDFINDGVDNSDNGEITRNDGGGNTSDGGGNTSDKGDDDGTKTTITEKGILLTIKCNIKGAGVKYNGSFIGSVPKEIRISKAELLEKGDRIIEIGKIGFTSTEKYVVSLNTDNSVILKNKAFDGGYSGLNQSKIIVKKYIDDREYQFPQSLTGSTQTITFNLSKGSDEVIRKTHKLTINLSGVRGGNPIVLRKNGKKQTDLFPQLGDTQYKDIINTKYTIESADLSKYRVTNITYDDGFQMFPLDAKDNESLTMTFKLKTDYNIIIEVEAVSKYVPPIKPVIKLLKTDARLYNINKSIGVPIAFEKNSTVKAITIIVGDDILEFDDLGDGDIVGVTIPHNVFDKIGRYNIKLFPFSLNDYEEELAPPKPIKEIQVKPPKAPIFVVDETVKEPVKGTVKDDTAIDDAVNQYIQTNTNTNYYSNNIGSNGYNFNFTGLDNFLGIDYNSEFFNNYK
jgi:hypothetical protein